MTDQAMTAAGATPLYPYRRSPDQDRATPARHPVVVAGAGPVGLTVAIDLAARGMPVVVLDDSDRIGSGSRAICFARRSLEILDRLGCGDRFVDKGVTWSTGKVFFGDRQIHAFDLLPEGGYRRPAFINLQQYYFEHYLVDRIRALQAEGRPIDLRGGHTVTSVAAGADRVGIGIATPDGDYELVADWLLACDGAGSPIRGMIGADFVGQAFADHFLIADVRMEADFPTERRFWFDPPFNPGQSALLHRQPDNIWRIDLQLGRDIDRDRETRPDRVVPRLRAMLGPEVRFELEWVSIYSFQCRRMAKFRHGRILFAGDSAHQVSPFGARGANGGLQDADNLGWKLHLVQAGLAPDALLDSYDAERLPATDDNIRHSTRATEFITPQSATSRRFRDAALDLSTRTGFARRLVNSGRLSVPAIHDSSPLNGPDAAVLPRPTRPGAPAADAPLADGWLLDRLGRGFCLLVVGKMATDPWPDTIHHAGLTATVLRIAAPSALLAARYLGPAPAAVYLMRPDQHVAARWTGRDCAAIRAALAVASGNATAPPPKAAPPPESGASPEAGPPEPAALITRPNMADPDDIHARLIALHDGRPADDSHRINARLILILANHIGDAGVLEAAFTLAAKPPAV